MPSIEWRHSHRQLMLPAVVLPGYSSDNPTDMMRLDGLLDTGATGTGIRADIARRLELRPKGQRRVETANGVLMAAEYVIRIGFICGDYTDPSFVPAAQMPFVLEDEIIGFELQAGFNYPLLVGMDVISRGDLAVWRTGHAKLDLP